MKVLIHPPNQVICGCTLLTTFCENGLKLENCFCISAGNNTSNFNQPINLLWKLQFELVNRSLNNFSSLQKTRNSMHYIIKWRTGRIKSQVFKTRFFIKNYNVYVLYKLRFIFLIVSDSLLFAHFVCSSLNFILASSIFFIFLSSKWHKLYWQFFQNQWKLSFCIYCIQKKILFVLPH